MWHLGMGFSEETPQVRLMVGVDVLGSLFQPRFCDSYQLLLSWSSHITATPPWYPTGWFLNEYHGHMQTVFKSYFELFYKGLFVKVLFKLFTFLVSMKLAYRSTCWCWNLFFKGNKGLRWTNGTWAMCADLWSADLILNFCICIPVINSRGLSEVMIASWKYKFIIWNYGSRPMELVKLKVSLLASSAWWSNYEHMQTWTDRSAKCTRPQHRWTSSSL